MRILSSFLGFCLFVPATSTVVSAQRVSRDVSTHEQIAEARRQSRIAGVSMERNASPASEDAARPEPPRDILSRSTILSFGGVATLVPKGSVLHVPERFRERLTLAPGARFVTWEVFLQANRAWVTPLEITVAQAEGKEPLPESTLTYLPKSGNVIVATYKGGPISRVSRTPETAGHRQP